MHTLFPRNPGMSNARKTTDAKVIDHRQSTHSNALCHCLKNT